MARKTLGTNVIPSHYTLRFEPNFQTFHFQGHASILVTIKKPTKVITLNAKELQVRKAEAAQLHASVRSADQEVILTFPKPLKGKVELTLDFTGVHNDGMYGFYRSKYSQGYLLTTQFESANARAAFPCFDEPAFKATFDVSLIVPRQLFTISNMPVKQERILPDNRKIVSFHTSPKMSTYLLYLGVGDFKYISTRYRDIEIRVFTVPEKIKYASLALHYTSAFLRFFEKYFQVNYPLPKLDVIAIPDFASGAMENWGAITFREIALLGDEHTSVAVKQQIAITIAHELAHQWFGNLVTMEWWDDLWLNESFATFMGYKAVHESFPEWDVMLQYYEDTIADALSADQLESTHPISVVVNTPGEIDEIFDRISYDKGGSVLHMLEDFVAPDVFRRGLTRYLQKHAYANATKEDLWKAIQQAHRDQNVVRLMNRWITQPGYPIVEVTKTEKGFMLTQQRFTLTGKKLKGEWLIPLHYLPAKGSAHRILMQAKSLLVAEKSEWIKLNHGQNGLYRVKYDAALLSTLGLAIKSKKISPLDAVGIENDLFAITHAGKSSVKDYLSFVEKSCLQATYPLDSSISAHLGMLLRLFYGRPLYTSIQKTSLLFHQQLLRRLGWERAKNEKNTTTLLRSATIASLGLLGHKETLQKANALFNKIKQGDTSLDSNLRGAIYALAAWQGNEKTFHYLLDRYTHEELPEENRKLLRSLGLFQDKNLLQRALELSQSATVRLQDSFMIPMMVSINPAGQGLLWNWTKRHWKMLLQKYNCGTHMLPTFVHNLSYVDNKAVKRDLEEFFRKKEHFRDDIRMAYRQLLEKIDINIQILERNKER